MSSLQFATLFATVSLLTNCASTEELDDETPALSSVDADADAAAFSIKGLTCKVANALNPADDKAYTIAASSMTTAVTCAGTAAITGAGAVLCLVPAGVAAAALLGNWTAGAIANATCGEKATTLTPLACEPQLGKTLAEAMDETCPGFLAGGQSCKLTSTTWQVADARAYLGKACATAQLRYLRYKEVCGTKTKTDIVNYNTIVNEYNSCATKANAGKSK